MSDFLWGCGFVLQYGKLAIVFCGCSPGLKGALCEVYNANILVGFHFPKGNV